VEDRGLAGWNSHEPSEQMAWSAGVQRSRTAAAERALPVHARRHSPFPGALERSPPSERPRTVNR